MISRQLAIFLVVGITTVLIDFVVYTILFKLMHTNPELAKGISFITGTVFAYASNRKWTFEHQGAIHTNIVPFCLLYASTLFVNVSANGLLLDLFEHIIFGYLIAFLIATILSATLNFAGMKWWVFKHPGKGAAS